MSRRTVMLSAAHFCVDFACAALYFGLFSNRTDWWTILLLYNACAFAAQLPIGIAADVWNHNRLLAVIGVALVLLGYAASGAPLPAAALAGIGNAAFHVGAGTDVLTHDGEKAGPLGLFVSPGAIGLYVGTVFAGFLVRNVWIVLLVLAACTALIQLSDRGSLMNASENARWEIGSAGSCTLPLLALVCVVALRSLLGTTTAFSAEGILPLIGVFCVAAGKASGGLIADWLGLRLTALISLGLSAVFVCIPNAWTHLAALLLFNMTMPLTLHAAALHLKSAKGFSFGLLTFALFLGLLPKLLQISIPDRSFLYAGMILLSLALLLLGVRRIRL